MSGNIQSRQLDIATVVILEPAIEFGDGEGMRIDQNPTYKGQLLVEGAALVVVKNNLNSSKTINSISRKYRRRKRNQVRNNGSTFVGYAAGSSDIQQLN